MQTVLSCPEMKTRPDDQARGSSFRIYSPASLGVALRHYRREAGLSQAELADLTGLNRTYLSALERGKETEQVKRLLRVLKQLGVRVTLEKADW